MTSDCHDCDHSLATHCRDEKGRDFFESGDQGPCPHWKLRTPEWEERWAEWLVRQPWPFPTGTTAK